MVLFFLILRIHIFSSKSKEIIFVFSIRTACYHALPFLFYTKNQSTIILLLSSFLENFIAFKVNCLLASWETVLIIGAFANYTNMHDRLTFLHCTLLKIQGNVALTISWGSKYQESFLSSFEVWEGYCTHF